MSRPVTVAARIAGGCLVAGIVLLLGVADAGAVTCDITYFPPPDGLFYPNVSSSGQIITTMQFNQVTTNWAGMAVVNLASTTDYDLNWYTNCYGSTQLASSAYGTGRTDFVIGDYNNDPTGVTDVDVHCYAGGCSSVGTYGVGTWRTGGLMNVDFPPVTLNFTSNSPYSPDMIMHVWDVYLNAGTTYYFQFSSSLGSAAKLCLMRNPNPGGGTYWAGRSSAAFETSGCTTYTANVTGYYGLVMVNDTWALGTATVGVFSSPQCACADSIPPLVPVAVTTPPSIAYEWAHHQYNSWAAIGVRPAAGSDWDLQVGSGGSDPACPQSLLATSTSGGSVTDLVAVDFNHVPPNQRAPFAIDAFRYSGAAGAHVEADYTSSGFGKTLQVNGPQAVQVWGANDVLECWDVFLNAGTQYTVEFGASANMRVLLFRNPGNGLYAAGRSSAVVQSATTFDYTPPTGSWFGVVVVKDDDQSGYFGLRVGTCPAPDTLAANSPNYWFSNYAWNVIQPQAGAWQAVGLRCLAADWDLSLYGSGSSAAWPDCYGPLVTASSSSSVQDFVVGDFHANAPGNYPFMVHQYTSGPTQQVTYEWTGPATPITVNAPTTLAAPPLGEVLRIYEANLVGGFAYTIGYAPNSSNRPLLVFGNPSGATYWAPRGSALLSTTATTTFTPASSGPYAFVVANDANDTTTFSLRIGTNPTGVGDPPRFVTAFAGARPNPGRAELALEYSLAVPAQVRLELVDVAGRRVWASDEGVRDAGAWSARVTRAGPGGRIPAGLYFAHLLVDGRRVETRKVTLLD